MEEKAWLGHSRYGYTKAALACSWRKAREGVETVVSHHGGGVDRVVAL